MLQLPQTLFLKLNILLVLFISKNTHAQTSYNVLHYTETSGFDHNTRTNSLNMFQGFSNLKITDDQTGAEFDTLSNLLSYDLIIFSNTSGDAILDSTQKSHFEQYIQNGGALLGLHAATDTYRHSTANGSSTGSWDFYAETMGGSVQQNPNHVAGTPAFDIFKIGTHPTTDSLPNPWNKNEEYYYWENGYLDSNNTVVLEVETTVGPNSQVNSYDSARAVSWYKVASSGSKIFYTSMGHANSNFTTDTLFQQHLADAVKWCLGLSTGIESVDIKNIKFKLYPNPTSDKLVLEKLDNKEFKNLELSLFDMNGKLVLNQAITNNITAINLRDLDSGVYLLVIDGLKSKLTHKIIKE